MNRTTIGALAAAVLCASFLGCGPTTVQKDAAVLASNTGRLNDQIESLTRSRIQIESVRARLTDAMDLSSTRTENFNQRTLAEWGALKADANYKARSDLYEAIRAYTEAAATRDAALAAAAQKVVQAQTQAKGQRSDELAATAKSLASLSQSRTFIDELQFLQGYVKEVQDDVKKAKEEAQTATDSATAKASSLKDHVQPTPKP